MARVVSHPSNQKPKFVTVVRMKKKGSSKWFSTMSAVKFYGGVFGGLVFLLHSFNGFMTKSFDEMVQFDLLSGSPLITLVLTFVAFAMARDSYKNQRW